MVSAVSSGKANASEPHPSQCERLAGALLSPDVPAFGTLAVSVLRLHTPPSWPVRTASTSLEIGEISANRTARKLRTTAKRIHNAAAGAAAGEGRKAGA